MDQILFQPTEPHPLETVPENEAALIERIVQMQIGVMKSAQDPSKRGQHPKQQAILRGVLEVADILPEPFRAGVLAEGSRFDAIVRFSTGQTPRDDEPNPHAIAVKLFDVPASPTGTQDFIMLDQPTFFIRDIADYVTFFEDIVANGDAVGFFRAHPREFALNQAFNVVIPSHLERQYWAEVPVAMGDGAARLTWMPAVDNVSGKGAAKGPDGLREALADYFIQQGRTAKFTLAAQAFVDEATTPIEDATSVWPTPFEPVATLTIPPQTFDAPARYDFGEALSFTPWHCHPAHRPLGGIQRCRLRVYEESSRLRHNLTGALNEEPTLAALNAAFPAE